MARVALLIGTGEYGQSFKSLPAAPKDVEAISDVLRDSEMGGFDQVTTLVNKPYTDVAETVETWFRERQRDDLALLYISGHGVKDAQSDLYFAVSNTRKQKEELVRSTAIAASFVRDCIRESRAKRQIVILDCCFSGAFGDLLTKDDDSINLEGLLGAEGRVVLTSSSSIQYSFEQREGDLSIYTRYLVEGIRTGAADMDEDGAISVQELHNYASRRVQEESPAMSPKIIVLKDEGYQLRIAKTPLGNPKVKYRKEVEAIVQEDGDTIDDIFSRPVLEEWQRQLGLTDEETQTIEAEVLEPIRQRQAKIQRYQEVFTRAIQTKNPLGERERNRLKQLQQVLGLLNENIDPVEDEAINNMQALLKSEQGTQNSTNEEPLTPQISAPDSPIPLPSEAIPHSSSSLTEDDLSSEIGIDYTHLQGLLRASRWQESDRETADQMLKVIGKESWWEVKKADMLNFPCTDLKTINQLWIKYSSGQFGFSVQKQIYVKCGAKSDGKTPNHSAWTTFCDQVGWRLDERYISYDEVAFNISAPIGHLPSVWWGGGIGWWHGVEWSYDEGGCVTCFSSWTWRLVMCRL